MLRVTAEDSWQALAGDAVLPLMWLPGQSCEGVCQCCAPSCSLQLWDLLCWEQGALDGLEFKLLMELGA